MTTLRPRLTEAMQLRPPLRFGTLLGAEGCRHDPGFALPTACRCRPIEASDLVQTLASCLLCAPAGWIAIDLFGLQCYNCPQTTALVIVFLSALFVSRRSG